MATLVVQKNCKIFYTSEMTSQGRICPANVAVSPSKCPNKVGTVHTLYSDATALLWYIEAPPAKLWALLCCDYDSAWTCKIHKICTMPQVHNLQYIDDRTRDVFRYTVNFFLNLCTPAPYKYLKKWIVLASDRRPESKSAKNLYGQIAARAVAKAPKFCHVTPTLKSLHWLKIYERIEYNLLSLTYKVLTTTQPGYLHNLTSAKSPRCTRSSSVVTLTHIFFIKITNRSFHYALPSLE